jgi:hypothetical protein
LGDCGTLCEIESPFAAYLPARMPKTGKMRLFVRHDSAKNRRTQM